MTSMRYRYKAVLSIITIATVLCGSAISEASGQQWQFDIGTTDSSTTWYSDTLDLERALMYVARSNSLIKSVDEMKSSAQSLIAQAGRRPNPELGFEIEEFGGSLPGFSESEWSLSVSQEIELWGKREARKSSAEVAAQVVDFESDVTRFDIFAETKSRYFSVALAQSRFDLAKVELMAANEMVDAVRTRVDKGAAMVTDLHLAELGNDRAKISLREAEANWVISRKLLISLWSTEGDEYGPFYVRLFDPPTALPILPKFLELINGERELTGLALEIDQIDAEIKIERSEALGNLTLSAGMKRLYADEINSFLVGVSWPLPLFDRRQNQIEALSSIRLATELKRTQLKSELTAQVKAIFAELRLFKARIETVTAEIIPKAQVTYEIMGEAFGEGRIPFTTMLEGKRILIDLETERNETIFEFWQKFIELEKILGSRLEYHSMR